MNFTAFAMAMPPAWLRKLLLVMKLTTMFLTVVFLQAGATGLAQKINLKRNNIPLEEVFRAIESQTGYVFFYDDKDLEDLSISVQFKDASLEEAMKVCLQNLTLHYRIVDKTIVIIRDADNASVVSNPAPADIEIKGRVTDNNGVALPGTNVKIKNSTTGTVTDTAGAYTIMATDERDIIIFSFIGFKTVEFAIGKRQTLDVVLQEDIASLGEVMVIAYGTSTKQDLTGSVSRVSGEVIQRQPLSDPVAALQGRVPGLQITNTSGLPGASVNIQIRGTNSLNKVAGPYADYTQNISNSPLYIVDGVPFISDPQNATLAGSINSGAGDFFGIQRAAASAFGVNSSPGSGNVQTSPFKSINPADIESIEVLKDADATAIYGARGANGVILITTKRGKAGKPQVTIDSYTGISQIPKYIDMMNTQQYLAMRREAFKNTGTTPSSDPDDFFGYAPDLTVWDTTAYINWQKKYASSTARTSNVQTTLSGGSSQFRYFVNGGYRKQTTVYGRDFGLTQGSIRMNLDYTSKNKRFTSILSGAYAGDKNKALPFDPFSFYNLAPNFPLYNANGTFNWNGVANNPEAAMLRTYTDKTRNLNSNLVVGYELLPGLNIKSSFGYNSTELKQEKLEPTASVYPLFGNSGWGSNSKATTKSETILAEPQLNYTMKVGRSGKFQTLVGGTYQQTSTAVRWIRGSQYVSDSLLTDISKAPRLDTVSSVPARYRYLSAFVRLNYNWNDKYIINGTLRTDGSSRFGPGRRYGTFGAVGAAWIFTKESWMQGVAIVSFGKLRGSYGITGNDKIGDYQYYNTYESSVNVNVPTRYQTKGVYSAKLFNADYHWETNKKLELAVDLGLAKDRIFITVDYYRNRSSNQLVNYPLGTQSGYGNVNGNLNAVIQNSGVEIDLTTTNIKRANFSWTTTFNISRQRNKLLSFPGLEGSPYRFIYAVGQSVSNIQGYVYEGVSPQDGKPVFKDVDLNRTFEMSDAITKNDQTIIGNTLPDFYGGFNNSFTYKGWQLDVFFNFRKLDKVFYRTRMFGAAHENEDPAVLNRWQHEGDRATYPRYSSSIFDAFGYGFTTNQSTAVLYNGSFIRLSNASLSYTLPEGWASSIRMKQVRLYALGQNLFTVTKYPGPDPETGVGVPTLRTVTLGAKISF